MSPWPVLLKDGDLTLKPLRMRDKRAWNDVRGVNREWLTPWDATKPQVPGGDEGGTLPTFYDMVMQHSRDGRSCRSISLAMWFTANGKENFIGQITLGGIIFGALRGAHIGYWIDQRFANRGLTSRAVNLLTDFAFSNLKLHRIEINIRPENEASKKVAEKCGYEFESLRPKFLHIDGAWRDHLSYVKVNQNIL